jgi:hypothetical protein
MAEEEDSGITETPEELAARKKRDEDATKAAEGVVAAGATGLGCLTIATAPWSIFVIILIIVLIFAWIKGCS